MRDWWYRAEKLPELDRIDGLGWDGSRREFATGLKDVPLGDLSELGGWRDPQTIPKCHQ